MIVGKYRKKPVEVEAVRWDGTPEEAEHIVAWINVMSGDAHVRDREWIEAYHSDLSSEPLPDVSHVVQIATLEGDMFALPGDWVIRGLVGEFYPCEEPVFEQSYTSVSRA